MSFAAMGRARTMRRGFTLIEVLIVVVILGILAAMVIPMVASASGDAIKAALRRQLQTIDHQIEIYKTNNSGQLPTADDSALGGDDNNGWGVLVSDLYLREEPFNTYASSSVIAVGEGADAMAVVPPTDSGWVFEVNEGQISVFAVGYNKTTDQLSNEIVEEE